jgi:hypothetical protein
MFSGRDASRDRKDSRPIAGSRRKSRFNCDWVDSQLACRLIE